MVSLKLSTAVAVPVTASVPRIATWGEARLSGWRCALVVAAGQAARLSSVLPPSGVGGWWPCAAFAHCKAGRGWRRDSGGGSRQLWGRAVPPLSLWTS